MNIRQFKEVMVQVIPELESLVKEADELFHQMEKLLNDRDIFIPTRVQIDDCHCLCYGFYSGQFQLFVHNKDTNDLATVYSCSRELKLKALIKLPQLIEMIRNKAMSLKGDVCIANVLKELLA